MMAGFDSSMIQLKKEREGERRSTNDLLFKKIGESVPIKPSDCQFDPQCIPAQPLAVSEHFQLIFVAHSNGFCIARIKDVIDSANEIKDHGSGSSILELSFLDINMDKVHILALSSDSSNLAACVAGDIFIYSVTSLRDKVQKPFHTCSLPGSSYVKVIHWNTKLGASFIVLSNHGKLYHGVVKEPLSYVMDNIDAVEWSIGGKYVCVARKNVLTILSSKFKEKFSMSLHFDSCFDDSDVNCTVKVDSIRWIRRDCIVLGCTQLSTDGEEKDYILQVITSKNGNFTDVSSERVVLYFSELFFGLTDDVVHLGGGPNLFLSYIETCELAITANRRYATDPHIVLISWFEFVDSDEAAVIEIQRDTLLPKIELQENGDDNLILGLCIDKSSISGRIRVKLGVEDWQEILPHCILLCLTLEGKLLLFHVGSIKGSQDVCQTFTEDAEDDPSLSGDQSVDNLIGSEVSARKTTCELCTEEKEPKPSTVINTVGKHNSGSTVSESSPLKTSLDKYGSEVGDFCKGTQKIDEVESRHDTSLKSSLLDLSANMVGDCSSITHKSHGFECRHEFSKGKGQHDMSSLSSTKHVQKGVKFSTEVSELAASEICSNPSLLSGKHVLSSTDSCGRSSGSFLNYSQTNVNTNFGACVNTEHALQESGKCGLNSVHSSGKPTLTDSTGKMTPITGPKISVGLGKVELNPPTSDSQSSSRNCSTSGTPNFRSQAVKEAFRSPPFELINSNSSISKQSGDINEAIKELDQLLRCIEEPGGFIDACSAVPKGPIAAVEQGIASVSEKCCVWRSLMDECVYEVEHILDKTVTVIPGKAFMKGIVKQATDNQFWDFWNHQKLNSVLEKKRRHILAVNQELNNQLIELERHFNTLDLHNFGAKDRPKISQEAFQSKFSRPRHNQSLHSLHNTLSSQLSAAEQISISLSNQMDALSIQSPVKQLQFKKELFETIGIPYDGAVRSSPEVKKSGNAISSKSPSVSSSAAINSQSKRNQSSILRSNIPETARRRRDLLAPCWASFVAPKTIMKRMLLHREEESKSKSSLAVKIGSRPHVPVQSSSSHSDHQTKPLTIFETSKKIGVQDLISEQLSEHSSSFRSAEVDDDPPQVNLQKPVSHLSLPIISENLALAHENVHCFQPDIKKDDENPLSSMETPLPSKPEDVNSVETDDLKIDLNSPLELSDPELPSPTPPVQPSPVEPEPESKPEAAECSRIEFTDSQGEDEMEEEASEVQGLNLGGFGIGSPALNLTNVAKSNPFSSQLSGDNNAGVPFQMSVPEGQFLRPAVFSAQSSVATNFVAPGGFGQALQVGPGPLSGGFGQASVVGPGQQALGSVLGGFGQSRQIGGGGFGGSGSGGSGFGGFSGGSGQSGGGFAGVGSSGGGFGGFSGVASGGGFGGVGSSGSGFGGAAAAAAPAQGGFGGLGSPPASQLFTQMRK